MSEHDDAVEVIVQRLAVNIYASRGNSDLGCDGRTPRIYEALRRAVEAGVKLGEDRADARYSSDERMLAAQRAMYAEAEGAREEREWMLGVIESHASSYGTRFSSWTGIEAGAVLDELAAALRARGGQ